MPSEYELLRINLSTQEYKKEVIPLELIKKTIGGKGLASHFMLSEIKPRTDPFSAENKLIIALGPLSGTIFPTGNRYGLFFKSPLTGTYFECYSGGSAANLMRMTGLFMIIIEGKATQPLFLTITNTKVQFHEATRVWGKDAIETYDLLKKEYQNNAEILCIGPAGENLVRFANVNNKYHHAGRGGGGAVMGSKMLKAIVFSGNVKPEINTHVEFKSLVQEILQKLREKPDIYGPEGMYRKYGTPSIVDWTNDLGCFPTRYFTACYSDFKEKINATALNSQILKKRTGCWNCPYTCLKYVKINDGPFKCELEGPEYETIALLGGVCDISDIGAIAMLNEFCDRMGLDTMSAGSICGLMIEAKHRGRLPKDIALSIDYNKPLEIRDFFGDIAYRRNIGDVCANGTKIIAEKFHLEDFAMHVKGLDFAGYDPRAFRGFALSYGVAPEGPTHLRTVYHSLERNHPNRLSYENKVEPMISEEDRMAIIDSLIVCKFIRVILDWDTLVKIYNTIFDSKVTVQDLRKIAADMIQNSRIFNVREGFTRKDDYMPDRAYTEVLRTKNGTEIVLDREKYGQMLDEYYRFRKWSQDGIPPHA